MGVVGIRDPTKDDFAAWLPLWRGYNAYYGSTRVYWQTHETNIGARALYYDKVSHRSGFKVYRTEL